MTPSDGARTDRIGEIAPGLAQRRLSLPDLGIVRALWSHILPGLFNVSLGPIDVGDRPIEARCCLVAPRLGVTPFS